MNISGSFGCNERGHLTIGGADAVELAGQYGTPLYVLDEQEIRRNCQGFVSSMNEFYDGNGMVLYASKAFSCKEMYRIVMSEGMGADVVSGGEIYTALKAGFPMEKIYFHGNNKTYDELVFAIESGVGRIVVDNIFELETLSSLAKKYNRSIDVLLRIKPGVDAHTHDFIRTGQIDSKFGFALETGEAMAAVRLANATDGINLVGIHCHIGSQIFDISPFEYAARVMMEFIERIEKDEQIEIQELNLGGGFGIKYLDSDNPAPFRSYMERVSRVIKEECIARGLKTPYILIEPGRAIVGATGATLYTVGAVKEIPDIRTYVTVDGGMCDNPRYILYKSVYEAAIANKFNQERDFTATIAGKCCESGDLIQENTMIQKPEVGDTLAVFSTGAYNYSMSSNYNRIPRPATIMVNGGEARVIIKRETYEDIIRNDI